MGSIIKFVKTVFFFVAVFLVYTCYTRGPEKALDCLSTMGKACKVAFVTFDGDELVSNGADEVAENFIPLCLEFVTKTGSTMEGLYDALSKSKKKLSTCSKLKANGEVVLYSGGDGVGKYSIKYKDKNGERFMSVSVLGTDMIKIPADKIDKFLSGMKEYSEREG